MAVSDAQLGALEEAYRLQPYPGRTAMEQIAEDLALSIHKVRCWFNNRRARATREQQRRIAASRAKAIGEDDGRRLKSAAGEEGCVPNRTARRLSLPANLGNGPLLPLETLDANKPYRHRATDDLRCEGESKKRDSTDVLVDTVSREANLILARVNDQPNSKLRTDQCVRLLRTLVNKAETFTNYDLAKGLFILVAIARALAYGIGNLSDANQDRTRFTSFLAHRLLYAILRTSPTSMTLERRADLHQLIKFFATRVSQYVDVGNLAVLPGLFLDPWPEKGTPLRRIMQGDYASHKGLPMFREIGEVAQARLDVLISSGRLSEAANLAKYYADGGVIPGGLSPSEFFTRYVNILLDMKQFDAAVGALLQNRAICQGGRVTHWTQRLIEAGSSKHAEILLQVLSTSSSLHSRAPQLSRMV